MSDEKINETKTQSESARKKSSLSWRNIGILCSAFSIVVLIVVGGYSCWYLITANMQVATWMSHTQNQLQQLQSDFNTLKTTTDATQQTAQQSMDDLKNVKETVAKLSEEAQGNQEKWLLTEARYYVKIANDNLQYSHNIPSALSLLKMADQEISQITGPKVTEIRKAIAADIANLQSLPQVDVAGLYMKLSALNNQLDQLPLQSKQTNVQQPAPSEQNQTKWQRVVQAAWHALKNLVVIRYNPNGTLPLMTPDQQLFLYQNLHAMLQQSIWALLNQQPAIYQTSLHELTVWITRYFVEDAPLTRAVLNSISQLEKIDIHPPVLTLVNTLQAFNGV